MPDSNSHDVPSSGATLLDRWRIIGNDAVWFIIANFLDAAMTWIALMKGGRPGMRMVEGNRIAAFFLHHWGFKGMFGLKLTVVVMVCVIALAIVGKRPDTAQGLLKFGTLVVIFVVLYSVFLYFRVRAGA